MGAHLLQDHHKLLRKLLGLWRRIMLALGGSGYSKRPRRQLLEWRQVCINAHPLRQEGSLGLEDVKEAGARQGEVGQVDSVSTSKIGGPEAESANGHDGVVALREQSKVLPRRCLLPVASKHHIPLGSVDVLTAPLHAVAGDHKDGGLVPGPEPVHGLPEVGAIAHHTLPVAGHNLQVVATAHVDTHEGAREAPGAAQAELSQETLGLFPKVVVQGELAPDLSPEMVEEGPGAREARELQERILQVRVLLRHPVMQLQVPPRWLIPCRLGVEGVRCPQQQATSGRPGTADSRFPGPTASSHHACSLNWPQWFWEREEWVCPAGSQPQRLLGVAEPRAQHQKRGLCFPLNKKICHC